MVQLERGAFIKKICAAARENGENDGFRSRLKDQIENLDLSLISPWPKELDPDLEKYSDARDLFCQVVDSANSDDWNEKAFLGLGEPNESKTPPRINDELAHKYHWLKGSVLISGLRTNPPSKVELPEIESRFLAAREPYERILDHTQRRTAEILQKAGVPEEKSVLIISKAAYWVVRHLTSFNQTDLPRICRDLLIDWCDHKLPPVPSDWVSSNRKEILPKKRTHRGAAEAPEGYCFLSKAMPDGKSFDYETVKKICSNLGIDLKKGGKRFTFVPEDRVNDLKKALKEEREKRLKQRKNPHPDFISLTELAEKHFSNASTLRAICQEEGIPYGSGHNNPTLLSKEQAETVKMALMNKREAKKRRPGGLRIKNPGIDMRQEPEDVAADLGITLKELGAACRKLGISQRGPFTPDQVEMIKAFLSN